MPNRPLSRPVVIHYEPSVTRSGHAWLLSAVGWLLDQVSIATVAAPRLANA